MHLLAPALPLRPQDQAGGCDPGGFHPALLDVVSLIAMGSTLGAVFLKRLGDSPLWPSRDPRLAEAANYTD